jgi:hypothetical protein
MGRVHLASSECLTSIQDEWLRCVLGMMPCSSIKKLHADLSAEVAALAGEGPTADELRRYKKVRWMGWMLHARYQTTQHLLPAGI